VAPDIRHPGAQSSFLTRTKQASASSSRIVQCVDHARLQLAFRFFPRFSIIFSLRGTMFTAWLNQTEVIISKNIDIKKGRGLDTFIRAIVQVTCDLTMYNLDMYQTVAIYGDSAFGDHIIPRFSVTMPSQKIYVTKGIPIWQSASIFGRGTVVWNVEVPETATGAPGTNIAPPEASS
jgi:hypothetical protein